MHPLCALCGKNQDIRELYPATFDIKKISNKTYYARRLPDNIHYRIVRCSRCGLVFSSPILPPSQITKLYRRSICTYDEQIPFVTKTYLDLFFRIRRYLPKQLKVLEVGCGSGFFLKALQRKSIHNVWGVEPGKQMVEEAPERLRHRITNDVFKKQQFARDTFDAVCCFHTLDHMTDPNMFAKEAYNILKPGGFVLVVVHDTDGLSVKLFGERSPIFDIEHIYLFNKQTLRQLFLKHGFASVNVSDLTNTYPLSYWFRMSGLPASVKSIGQNILRVLGLAGTPFSFPGGNIALIAQKPPGR